jgi:hypothetical protein
MSAPVRIDQQTAVAVPPVLSTAGIVDVFQLQCETWALLWKVGQGEYSLPGLVDLLQMDAVRNGVVNEIGQDAVQQIMSTAFEEVRYA